MATVFNSPRATRPSKLVLEQHETLTQDKLEAAILHSSTHVNRTSPSSVHNAARDIKDWSNQFEDASRTLGDWLRNHGHTNEAREVRRRRHKLVYYEAKESLADMNALLAEMNYDVFSDIDNASVLTTEIEINNDAVLKTHTENLQPPTTSAEEQYQEDAGLQLHQPTTAKDIISAVDTMTSAATTSMADGPVVSSMTTAEYNIYDHIFPNTSKTPLDSMLNNNRVAFENLRLSSRTPVKPKDTGAVPRRVSWAPTTSNVSAASTNFTTGLFDSTEDQINNLFLNSPLSDINKNAPTHGLRNSIPFQHVPSVSQLTANNSTRPNHQSTFRPHASEFIPQSQGNSLNRLDVQTRHLLRQELLKGSSDKFGGEAQHFSTWKSNLIRRLNECEADSLDSIQILLANTTGRPKMMIQHFLSAGTSDPDSTLRDVWQTLEQRFATSERISESLFNKLGNVIPIKNSNELHKLEDLLDLSRIIFNNMSSCQELSVFNLRQGMKLIWDKLPDQFISRWRSRYVRHEEETGSSPDFSIFLETFEKFVIEVSHPSFIGNCKPNTTRNVRALISSGDADDSCKPICLFHNVAGHTTLNCKSLSKISYNDRKQFVLKNKLCFLCLEKHFSNKCPNKLNVKCDKCSLNHCTLMHFDKRDSNENYYNSRGNFSNSNDATDHQSKFEVKNSCTSLCDSNNISRMCSKTLPVEVSIEGSDRILRCLTIIDEQSNASFCDVELVRYFNLSPPKTEYSLSTMTSSRKMSGSLVPNVRIRGLNSSNWLKLPSLLTHPNLPNTKNEIGTREIVSAHPHISHLASNFPEIDPTLEVMLLIGVNSGELMRTTTYGMHHPFVHKTALGYALVGPACTNSFERTPIAVKTFRSAVDLNICRHETSTILFPPNNSSFHLKPESPFAIFPDDELAGLSKEDVSFNRLMEDNICVNDKGNLQLPLPLKENVKLSNNKSAVFHRTKNSLDRLIRNPNKLQASLDVFHSYLKAGHVEQIPNIELKSDQAYFIPIFPVSNEQRNKIRLVFDSSAIFNGCSLNQALLQGPDLNNALVGVLIRFRLGEIAITGDIERMFHSFYVDPKHVDMLRFFWFRDNDPSKDIVQHRALVHIFGNKPSPAIANFALKYTTLHPEAKNLKEACSTIRNNFYVDDVLFSSDTEQGAIDILTDVRSILTKFNIRLHKILSSNKEVMRAFPPSELASVAEKFDISLLDIENRTLGIIWSSTQDTLSLSPEIPSRPFTKRGLLAVVNAVYDPLGIASPIVLRGRLLQRKIIPPHDKHATTELSEFGWDDILPDKFCENWKTWIKSLEGIKQLKLPRCYKPVGFGSPTNVEIHCFADASDEAIGFVMYLKLTNSSGEISVSFLFGNSKVAPRAANTIPRLELCASMEAAKTATKIASELSIQVNEIHFYSDSKIVIGYLLNAQKRFSRYVTRRVEEILKYSAVSQWHHIDGANNVGDIASRPQTISSLLKSNWLIGPGFLTDNQSILDEEGIISIELPEVKCNAIYVEKATDIFTQSICLRTTSWLRARLVVARVLKFIHLLKGCNDDLNCKTCNLNLTEAEKLLIKESQSPFASIRKLLLKGQALSSSDPLLKLSPFVDSDGLLRVGGRLKDSSFPGDVKHPILLPSDHPVTLMILQAIHQGVNHQGRFITMGKIRQSGYHILKCSSVLKKFINNCVLCRRLRGKCQEQMMANLPPDRLEESPPFTNVGLDLFGPYVVHDGKSTRRTNANKKVWGLLLTCLVSRAVHIELLPYLDTSSLQLGLRRFYAIRGTCRRIRSDQGTNIIGARNQLVDLSELKDDARKHGVQWELIPPAASSWGGIWERKVGAVKRVLECSLLRCGKSSLSRDELNTYLQECASIVNNTPLWECSDNPEDPAPLSPANLLTLRDQPNPPPPETFTQKDLMEYGKRRWRRIMFLCDEFWVNWRRYYLESLQSRFKWKKRQNDVKIGDVVIVKRNTKRNEWPTGRICSVSTGRDNLIRSVVIQFPGGVGDRVRSLERSIRDIVVLYSPGI